MITHRIALWLVLSAPHCTDSYRLCKKDGSSEATEACYQRLPLDFASNTTEVRYVDGSRAPFFINATTSSSGTWPEGSQWRKNPIPMCNCDAGIACSANATRAIGCSKANPYACYGKPYPTTYLAPGQHVAECPTGLMFPSAWNEGAGAGETPHSGMFRFELADLLRVPSVPAGEYSLSWRWDCEQTPQVWNSCADIRIAADDAPATLKAEHEAARPAAATASPCPVQAETARDQDDGTRSPRLAEASTTRVSQAMTCSVTASSAPGRYVLAMTGGGAALGQQNCNFVAAGRFLSGVTMLADWSQHCSHAEYAGCHNYGSPFALNCVCACDVEDVPGAGCRFNWTAAVVADSMPTCACADARDEPL